MLLLDAVAHLTAEGVPLALTLAGDGPMRALLEEQIRRLGLESRVRITGYLSNDAVRREMLAARVLALPSFAEGLPVVLMEALALGRPVISTYVAGIPELVEDGVNGWLVPAGSVAALAAALRRALDCPTSRLAEMGRVGAERVAARHNAVTEAARLAALFRGRSATHRATAVSQTSEVVELGVPS
jgi:glycosyltransferase involved in cell wall biosynthesis